MSAHQKHKSPSVGDTFGLWTVGGKPISTRRGRLVPCCCKCGLQKDVCLTTLINGYSKSCHKCTSVRRGQAHTVACFWKKVRKTRGCWLWIGALTDKGYGNFWDGKRFTAAHVFSWELEHKQPMTFQGNHTCDNRQCVRPSHVYDGTQKQNMEDASRRGRLGRRSKKNE